MEGGQVQEHEDREKRLTERVWSLHCRGKTVNEIAKGLAIEPGEARLIICEIWKSDKGA